MLIKNVLKSIKSKPIRLIGIISLVLFASLLYVSFQYTIQSIENTLYDYVEDYNQEDFSFNMNIKLDEDEVTYVLSQTNHDYEREIHYLQDLYEDDKEIIYNRRITELEELFEINIEPRSYKQMTYESEALDKSVTIRLFKNGEKINKTYVESGRLPEETNEIAIGSTFASSNDLNINDTLTVKDKTYKIVGFVFFVDYIYPQLTNEGIIFDNSKQVLACVSDTEFENIHEGRITYFSGDFNKDKYTKDDINQLSMHRYMNDVIDAKSALRTGAIYGEVDGNKAMSTAMSGVILFLAVIIIGIIVNKSINQEKTQIGVIKSLGYSNFNIMKAYMVYPLIASVIGTIMGYFLGQLSSQPFIEMYQMFYQMPTGGISFDFTIFIYSVIVPIIALNIFSSIVIYYIVRKKPLDLIRIKSDNKVNRVTKTINKMLSKLSFKRKFKYSIAFRGIGKLYVTFMGVLIASFYLVFALSATQSFDIIINEAFGESSYQYQIQYDQFKTEKKSEEDRYMMISSKIKLGDEFVETNLIGLERTLETNELVNEYNENLLNPLYNGTNNVVITAMLAYTESLEIGDTITIIDPLNQSHNLKVVGIVENYMNSYLYIQKGEVNGFLNLPEDYYNGVWTKEKPINNDNIISIFDKEDLKETLESMMGLAKAMIGLLIVISMILAFIVLVLIANFNIEDNLKILSFLKVMGYKDKEISNMAINIYVPIVVVAYLISIPLTLFSLEKLMAFISEELNFAIPFKINILQVVIGLSIILGTYYISLYFSKRKLNKISLQESLKYNE